MYENKPCFFGSFAAWMVIAIVTFLSWGCPHYNVWEQGLSGQAELARAEQNRKIKVQEAQAHRDSATLLAEAEVLRAEGGCQSKQNHRGKLAR